MYIWSKKNEKNSHSLISSSWYLLFKECDRLKMWDGPKCQLKFGSFQLWTWSRFTFLSPLNLWFAKAKQKPGSGQAGYWWARKHLTLSTPSANRLLGAAQSCVSVSGGLLALQMPCVTFSHGNPVFHEIMSMYSCLWPLQVNLLIKHYLYAREPGSQESHSTGKDNVWSSSLFVKKKQRWDAVGQRRPLTRSQLSCGIRQFSTKCLVR